MLSVNGVTLLSTTDNLLFSVLSSRLSNSDVMFMLEDCSYLNGFPVLYIKVDSESFFNMYGARLTPVSHNITRKSTKIITTGDNGGLEKQQFVSPDFVKIAQEDADNADFLKVCQSIIDTLSNVEEECVDDGSAWYCDIGEFMDETGTFFGDIDELGVESKPLMDF